MPIGTVGAVKGITPAQIREAGAEIILSNTYHLMLRPGVEVVERVGGLHRFMAWDGPILTDSGGYQVFSLSALTRLDDEGVEFASHIDGRKVWLDPPTATSIQNLLGADIIMCLDECPPYRCGRSDLERAVKRTIRWASQCREAHKNAEQMLFAITQGGIDTALREYCGRELVGMDFDGYALGGLSVGESREDMLRVTAESTGLLPPEKPRYLMGVGTPMDIIAAVLEGIDMFDCVLPTRNGRNAYAFTEKGPVRLRNSSHSDDRRPIEGGCECYTCRTFSRAALRHFFKAGEMLGPILTSIHNIAFYQRLMGEIRQAIEEGNFSAWAERRLAEYGRCYG
jgi:queuine tRNA-ribosyltransferase